MDFDHIKATECPVPEDSAIRSLMADTDYEDSFYLRVKDKKPEPVDLVKYFFLSTPPWFNTLMQIREKLARLVGLKTAFLTQSEFNRQLETFQGVKGETLALFKTCYCDDQEIVFEGKDKHLDFYFSFKIDPDQVETGIFLSTTVSYNNVIGPLYFFPVRFIHRIAIPKIMNRMMKKFFSQKNF